MTEPICDMCERNAAAGYYDDLTGRHFCDKRCFHEWADANFEEIVGFYWRMNID